MSDQELLQAGNWHAARHGLNRTLLDPYGHPHSSGDVLCSLLRHVTPALEEAGDLRQVSALVHRLLREGTPPTASVAPGPKADCPDCST